MLPLVATMRPTAIRGWSQFFRIKLADDSAGKSWTTIPDPAGHGLWQPWLSPADVGRWIYHQGRMIVSPPSADGRELHLDKLHWDFANVCQRTELTGPGLVMPGAVRMTWVMGPGKPHKKGRPHFDPSWPNPQEWPEDMVFPDDPVPAPDHKSFKIRIVRGRQTSQGVVASDQFDLEIKDDLTGQSVQLHYSGLGLKMPELPSSPFDPNVALGVQPWAEFRTNAHVPLSAFKGDAQMMSDPGTGQLRLSLESENLILKQVLFSGPSVKKGMIELPTSGKSAITTGGATKGSLN